jgi:PAT family beta-lactamase induction signal transducer AmpG
MCGLSLFLSGATINFWLASLGIDTKIIGLFSLIVIPYVFKFLIAIFIERNKILWLSNKIGNYKAWLLLSQLMLTIVLFGTSFLDPKQNLWLIALSGFLIALFAVVQDIILNANRIKILDADLKQSGNALYTVGYRLGMLFSGAGVILASVYISWGSIYLFLAVLYLTLTIYVLYFFVEVEEGDGKQETLNSNTTNFYKIFIEPFENFFTSKNFIWIISFVLMYKVSDEMLAIMLNPFLLDTGYTAAEIASISKFFGVIMIIIGGLISAPIIAKLTIRTSIISFSLIHTFGHLFFIILSAHGKSIPFLYFITGYEALTGGMMMTAYLSFISNLCKGKHIATQYALLSSGMGLSRAIFPATSGLIADYYGWVIFFIIISSIAATTTIFTFFIPKRLFEK